MKPMLRVNLAHTGPVLFFEADDAPILAQGTIAVPSGATTVVQRLEAI